MPWPNDDRPQYETVRWSGRQHVPGKVQSAKPGKLWQAQVPRRPDRSPREEAGYSGAFRAWPSSSSTSSPATTATYKRLSAYGLYYQHANYVNDRQETWTAVQSGQGSSSPSSRYLHATYRVPAYHSRSPGSSDGPTTARICILTWIRDSNHWLRPTSKKTLQTDGS